VLICNIEIYLWGKGAERSEYAGESVITEFRRMADGRRTADGGRRECLQAKRQKNGKEKSKTTPHPLKKKSVSLEGARACGGGEPTTYTYLKIFVSLPHVRDRTTE
jgi:hypothetical protein